MVHELSWEEYCEKLDDMIEHILGPYYNVMCDDDIEWWHDWIIHCSTKPSFIQTVGV